MALAIIAYALAIIGVCYLYRPKQSYVDYVVGEKSSGWTITAFGLFTLIGGGELVAGSTFGHVFGWAGIALFVGYGIAFAMLGFLSFRVIPDAAPDTVTYAEYADQKYGRAVGLLVSAAHIITFFALLVLQLSAGGHVVSQLTEISYNVAVVMCAATVGIYLLIGGFRAVMITDVVQGVVMLLLVLVVGYAVSQSSTAAAPTEFETPNFHSFWGVMISGIVIGLASADVWQRVFAARSVGAARTGLVLGGLALTLYGTFIVYIGILSKTTGLTSEPNEAFLSVLESALPGPILAAALFATIAAILSTADTEVFLVSSLLDRTHRKWFGGTNSPETSNAQFHRSYIVAIVALACVASFWGSDLATFFNWMFVGYMAFAPTIAVSLFVASSGRAVLASFAATAALFVILLALNVLTLENSYLLTIPALIILPAFRLGGFMKLRHG